MTDWKYSLYLVDLFDEFGEKDDEDLTEDDIEKIAKGVYQRLLLLQTEIREKDKDPAYMLRGLNGLDNIIDELKYFDYKTSYDNQLEEFDKIMDELYDYADYHYVWINTFDTNSNGVGKP